MSDTTLRGWSDTELRMSLVSGDHLPSSIRDSMLSEMRRRERVRCAAVVRSTDLVEQYSCCCDCATPCLCGRYGVEETLEAAATRIEELK